MSEGHSKDASEAHTCDLTRFEGPKCVSILPLYSNRVKSQLCAFNDYVSILVHSKKNKTAQMSVFLGAVKDRLGVVKYDSKTG